jgi:hypothetical protein
MQLVTQASLATVNDQFAVEYTFHTKPCVKYFATLNAAEQWIHNNKHHVIRFERIVDTYNYSAIEMNLLAG